MDLAFFKNIFGKKMIEDLELELDKAKKAWNSHVEKDSQEHEVILGELNEIKIQIQEIVEALGK